MTQAGRMPGRQRDEAGRPENPVAEAAEKPGFAYSNGGGVQWRPRDANDGKTAVQLSDRTVVFSRPAPMTPSIEDADTIAPPVMGDVPTSWTADLVYCRLLVLAAYWRRLPPMKWPTDRLRSFLTALQPQPSSGRIGRPLTPAEELRMDWTDTQLRAFSLVDQAVLYGFMGGASVREIAAVTVELHRRGYGDPLSKSSVHRRWRSLTKALAADWNEARQTIDDDTRDAWAELSKKK